MKSSGPSRETRSFVNQVSKIVARLEQRGIEASDVSKLDNIVNEMCTTIGVERSSGERKVDTSAAIKADGANGVEPGRKPPRTVIERSDLLLPSAELVGVFREHAAFRIIPEGMKASCPVAVTGDRGPAVLAGMFHPAFRFPSQLPLTTCRMSRGQRRLEVSDIELERYLGQHAS